MIGKLRNFSLLPRILYRLLRSSINLLVLDVYSTRAIVVVRALKGFDQGSLEHLRHPPELFLEMQDEPDQQDEEEYLHHPPYDVFVPPYCLLEVHVGLIQALQFVVWFSILILIAHLFGFLGKIVGPHLHLPQYLQLFNMLLLEREVLCSLFRSHELPSLL